MVLKRPEGLSPCYYSLASPDIPESHILKWTFRGATSSDEQTKYTINIKDSDRVVVKTITVSSSEKEVEMSSLNYAFEIGETYYWNVTTYGAGNVISEESVNAKFKYDTCPISPGIVWNYAPSHGDVIVSDTYFEEIKTNIIVLLADYDGAPASLNASVQKLFTGEVVPTRLDFVTLETVVDYLSTQLEQSFKIDIDEPVENSLGISDIERIKNHIIMLTTVAPKPVQQLSIEVDLPENYDVYGVNVVNDGKTDPTMDITWFVQPIPLYSGVFTFEKISVSKDIRYYRVLFQYGASTNVFTSEVYYKEEDIYEGALRSFETNWAGLYTVTTIGLAKQSMQVFAVDNRGNTSIPTTVNKTYGSNFTAPLGVKNFEVQYQKAVLGDTNGPYPTRPWYTIYTGTALRATHKVTGGEGRVYYRVRAIDLSGMTTPWIYDNGVSFDPLTPPAAPKLSFTSTTTSIVVDWEKTARAEYYQWKMWSTGTATQTTGTGFTKTGAGSAKEYGFYVRAGNRIGWSSWSGIMCKTKTARMTKETRATKGKSWRDNWGWNNSEDYVYQGEWCEIAGSPHRVISKPVGYCWGKYKGMWLFDDNYWRAVLAGKKIIKTEIWIQRKSFYHGYYNDQTPTFWLHNYDTFPKGQPSLFGKFTPSKDFDLGESAWVTVPNYYAEYIRDGKAKGVGLYRDNWGRLPYLKYYSNAKLRITYE